MSSTNRGRERNLCDTYVTPPWVIHRFLDEFQSRPEDLPVGRWFEPCAGDGSFIRTVNERVPGIVWSASELRGEMATALWPLSPGGVHIGDTLEMPNDYFGEAPFEVAISNPPFSLGFDFAKKCMGLSKLTIMLLRLNFWASGERLDFMQEFPPDTYVLPQRPAFTLNKYGKAATDSCEYAFFVFHSYDWYNLNRPQAGHIKVLGRTSAAERKEWTARLRREGLRLGFEVQGSDSPSPSESPAVEESP